MRLSGFGCVESHCGGRPLLLVAWIMFVPQLHRAARIEARLRHQLLADDVGFGFLLARTRQQETGLREHAAALHRRALRTLRRSANRAAHR